MAEAGPTDALGLLSAALNANDATSEARYLAQLYSLFQTQPGNLPILLPTLVSLVARAKSTLRKWIADVLDLAFCRNTISSEGRNALSVHTPDIILNFLADPHLTHAKTAIQVFASVYQGLFRHCCNDPSSQRMWQTVEQIKSRITAMFETSHLTIKIPAVKAFQRVVQVQTRIRADPRSRSGNDISVAMIPPRHPFLEVQSLEAEANKLLTQVVTLVFTSNQVDLVMACMNALSFLAKARPPLMNIVTEALVTWTPAALAGAPYTQIRNAEKTLRLIFIHIHRHGLAGENERQLSAAMETQKRRMEAAARADWERREEEAKRKRESIDDELSQAGKRQRLDDPATIDIYSSQAQVAGPSSQPIAEQQLSGIEGAKAFIRAALEDGRPNPLSAFDVTTLPASLVVELIIANLSALPDAEMFRAIESTRQRLNRSSESGAIPLPPQGNLEARPPGSAPVKAEATEEDEHDSKPPAPPDNPLKQDLGDDEFAEAADTGQPSTVAGGIGQDPDDEPEDALAGLEDFELAPPEPFSQTEAKALIKETVARICEMGGQAAAYSAELGDAVPAQTLWASLVTRLATRGLEAEEEGGSGASGSEVAKSGPLSQADTIRQMMLDFVRADVANRISFAVQWLAEEYYCDLQRKSAGRKPCYSKWLQRVLDVILPTVDAKDKTLFAFLGELPSLPDEIIDQLASLCHEKSRMAVGLLGLRDLAMSRPPCRAKAIDLLIDTCKNPDKELRARAIITVRGWVGGGGPLESTLLDAAEASLQRLTVTKSTAGSAEGGDDLQPTVTLENAPDGMKPKEENTEVEEGATAEDQRDPVKDKTFEITNESHVLQFVELPFALSVKIPDMLDRVFVAYASMPEAVQKAVQKHIAALVRSLGPNNPKLLQLLQNFPPGSDTLAMSVYNIMAEKGRTQSLVTAVKRMVGSRAEDIDAHLLVPLLPTLAKADMMKLLPRAVTILNSKLPEDRAALKNMFTLIVSKPAQGFGSVSTNQPRLRADSDLLTPVELMGILHSSEKEIGLKTTIEAIRICFSLTDIFRSEVLAAVLNQLVEEPELPTVFMRTAIMAVSTYRSLAGYVSSNLLSRLIVKKIWQNKVLWDGFLLCAEQTVPGSYAALLQLPQEHLVDVVRRKPALKEGLKAHIEKKVGGANKARLNAYMELLDGAGNATPTPGTVQGGTSGNNSPAP